ncbi:hypothetical protein ACWEHA_07380 [Amycolatopsis nivea]
MSMKRTLLSGLILAPLCLALPGTAAAAEGPGETLPLTTGWWPDQSSSQEESAVFAGIGGAGVLHHESGVDEWGNRWSEHHGSLAGIGGAAVLHSSQETNEDVARPVWHPRDTVRGKASVPSAAHKAAPAKEHVVTPVKAAPASRAKKAAARTVDAAPVRTIREAAPAGSSYHDGVTSAGPEGAASADVSSHAGRDHAWYSASENAAGPDGATSAGVAALAVPGAAGYRAWEVGAGPAGAYSHSTEAAADVREPDLD